MNLPICKLRMRRDKLFFAEAANADQDELMDELDALEAENIEEEMAELDVNDNYVKPIVHDKIDEEVKEADEAKKLEAMFA
eukprot:CAMPEP_0116876800 /NCGR_PEP_ID=MMETSP0463-20121206/8660_1 /TAXON_ID=181622 /ORGANISM="Strombidinopsis sp, Strain SopsisLIS2011" /LENGTH=80 /DNA_ID=CAMNT_0004523603 /DNA_START=435 /DNA_END=676 /DNA_ORIENTATION=+